MGKKVTPIFGNTGEDPNTAGVLQAIRMNVEALLKWARITEQKVAMTEQALVSFENALMQINGSLESVCRILIENDVVDQEQLHAYAKEYVDAYQELREEQAKQLVEELEKKKSKIWTPPEKKKIIPVT